MKIRSRTLVLLLGAATVLPAAHQVQPGHIPLYFEPNEGQAHASVQFLSQGVYLGPAKAAIHTGEGKPVVMSLVGARQSVQAEGLDLQPGITSYFIGNDPKKWRSGVPHYAKVQYKGVYPGIDVVYYGNAEGQLEYDFVVAAGADPSRIEIAYNLPLRKDGNGDLLIAGLRQKRPSVYQGGHEIAADYHLRDGSVQLGLADYDRSQALRIDPVLQYSTYLGGPGYDAGAAIAVDASGSSYITGYARSPAQPGLDPFQQPIGLTYNTFVIKLAPGGNRLAYFVFIGDQEEYGNGIALDSAGAAWITGETRSFNFPTKNPIQAFYGGGFNDAFITKVSSDGKSLLFSSYLGGQQGDIGYGIALDSVGSAYVAIQTGSAQLPVGKNAFQSAPGGGQDAYVIKLSSSGNFNWGTYFGGSFGDFPKSIAVDRTGQTYIAGNTSSSDFPVTNHAFQKTATTSISGSAAFVTKLLADGTGVAYSTLLGDSSTANAITVDSLGKAYVAGIAFGPNVPLKNPIQSIYGGGLNDNFIAEITPTGDALEFSTLLGGSNIEYGCCGLALGQDGSIYVSGHTTSPDFPVKNSMQPFKAAGTPLSGNAYIAQFGPSGQGLIFSSFFGGSLNELAPAIAVDPNGNLYVVGTTSSNDLPTKNPYQGTFGGGTDIFVAKFAPDAPLQPTFAISPAVVPFQFVIGSAVPSPQMITVTSGALGQPFTATADVPWLTLSSSATTTPGIINVSVKPAGLSAGTYSGTIQVNPQAAAQVNLRILNPAPVSTSISPSSIALGSNDTNVTISGSGFASGALVQFLGSNATLPTTFVDANTLRVVVSKDLRDLPVGASAPAQLPDQLRIGLQARAWQFRRQAVENSLKALPRGNGGIIYTRRR